MNHAFTPVKMKDAGRPGSGRGSFTFSCYGVKVMSFAAMVLLALPLARAQSANEDANAARPAQQSQHPEAPPEVSAEASLEESRQEQADAQADTTAEQTPEAPAAEEKLSEEEKQLIQLQRQLDELLTATGLPTDAQRADVAERLSQMAAQSNRLAKTLQKPTSKLEAYNTEMRTNYALAQNAKANNDEREASFRNSRVRSSAMNLQQLDTPAAKILGDFWLMQADLFDINQVPDLSIAARQQQVTRRLEQFLRDQAAEAGPALATRTGEAERSGEQDTANESAATGAGADGETTPATDTQGVILTDVKLALLRLYDQQGQSFKACALVEELSAYARVNDRPSLSRDLQTWYGYCPTLGRIFDAAVKTTDQRMWSSRDMVGQVVVIHFWANWFEASADTFVPLRETYEKHRDQGLAILSVDMGGKEKPGSAEQAADWPISREQPGPQVLQDLFAVRSLPRFVLINRKGEIVAIGGSTAILDQLPGLLSEPAPENTPAGANYEQNTPANAPDDAPDDAPADASGS